MGLNESERSDFVSMREPRGWSLEDDTIWSPDRGLWFSESHFQDWTLEQFCEIFARRADRIQKAGFDHSKQSARENRYASEVAQELLNRRNTQ
jgi:hypothetical protein